MKASYKPKQFDATDLVEYAEACGYGLARAHAKAGDAALIAGCGFAPRGPGFRLPDFDPELTLVVPVWPAWSRRPTERTGASAVAAQGTDASAALM